MTAVTGTIQADPGRTQQQGLLRVSRQEWKYQITQAQKTALARELAILLLADQAALTQTYTVRSLYFDTIEEADYHSKADGVRKRRKIRLRCYPNGLETGPIKLECKEKDGAYQNKTSLILTREEADAVIRGAYHILLEREESSATRLYLILTQGAYRPAAIVEYERRAFVWPDFHTRLTLDEQIRGCSHVTELFRTDLPLFPVDTDLVTLEVKFDETLAPAIRDLLSRHGLFHISAGKYGAVREI